MSRQESDKIIEEARLLLPWYLTNTLSDDEQELVNQALEVSPELRNEFVREEKMMRLVKENTSLLELSALDTTEQRLENTLARIEREDQRSDAAHEVYVAAKQPSQVAKNSWFSRLFERRLFNTEWLSPANAVFASLIAVQAGLLGYSQLKQPEVSNTQYDTASYEKQSGETSMQQLFLMEFQASAQHGEVCDFLNKWDARIVAGPSNRNVFTVEMETTPYTDAGALADVIMSQASNNDVPIVFIGPKFRDDQ